MSGFKGESGAQLLARLGTRPVLSRLDPSIFCPHHQGACSLSKHRGQLVELFGPEGTGKTELSLLYVARACLPNSWNGVDIGGAEAKVVVVDTDLKFSLLRLAIVIEAQLLALKEEIQNRTSSKTLDNNSSRQDDKPSTYLTPSKHCEENAFAQDDNCNNKPNKNNKNLGSDTGQNVNDCTNYDSTKKTPWRNPNCLHPDMVVKDQSEKTCEMIKREDAEMQEKTDCLSPEDIENIAMESLGRVQVVKPDNVQQLYMTLLSLEQSVTLDLQVALLVIDSVSAFFWEDRIAQNAVPWKGGGMSSKTSRPQAACGGMSAVAGIISRLLSDAGITVVMTKCPLVSNVTRGKFKKRKWEEREHGDSSKDFVGAGEDKCDEHVEFLGKAWADLRASRINLQTTQELKTAGGSWSKVVTASCSLWSHTKCFTFVDDVLTFL